MTKFLALLIALAASGLVLIPIGVQASSYQESPAISESEASQDIAEKPTSPGEAISWQACISCHDRPGHNHAGSCEWCHVATESAAQAEHPLFEPVADLCIDCHKAGSLP